MASHERAGVELLERFDPHAELRNKLRFIAAHTNEWAGIPVPLTGEHMVIEPSYPYAHIFNEAPDERSTEDAEIAGDTRYQHRNTFWSWRWRTDIHVWSEPDKTKPDDATAIVIRHSPSVFKSLDVILRTMGCSEAWGLEQEANALKTLATLLPHHMYKKYLLSGTIVESSKRSGVVYVFRKLRPTVAIKARGDHMVMLCALCMHAIGYYADSWAGAMCPTDDVIAHLMMMRADEHMFWKRCNQIPVERPQSGI